MHHDSVLIIGSGELGSSLASLLDSDPDREVRRWDANQSRVPGQLALDQELARHPEIILYCAPAKSLAQTLLACASHLNASTVVINCAKGLDPQTARCADELLADYLGDETPYAILGGPLLAEEIKLGGGPLIAARNQAARTAGTRLFARFKHLHVSHNIDSRGTSWCGVLKNVYALLIGAAMELESGQNTTGLLVSRSCLEMERMVERLGGKPETAIGPAGLADLVATGLSPDSANHQAGRALASRTAPPHPAEGLASLPLLVSRLESSFQSYPLLTAAHRLAATKESPRRILDEALSSS